MRGVYYRKVILTMIAGNNQIGATSLYLSVYSGSESWGNSKPLINETIQESTNKLKKKKTGNRF